MSIDWSATGVMLQGWGTLIGALAVIWAAKKGADTFDSWKRQKVAERKLEQAERILTATYKARRALAAVRSVMMWRYELKTAEDKLKEDLEQWALQSDDKQMRLATAQAYYTRLDQTNTEQNELFECLPMARALFGETLENAIESLSKQFWLIRLDVQCYIDDQEQDQDFSKKIRRSMYDVSPRDGENNEISDAITKAISAIEEICLPSLQ